MRRILSAAVLMVIAAPVLSAQVPGQQQPVPAAHQAAPVKPAKHTTTMATEAQIREAQTALSKKGLYKGAVTGTTNKEFETAVKKYQNDHKLKANGHVDEATLSALRKA